MIYCKIKSRDWFKNYFFSDQNDSSELFYIRKSFIETNSPKLFNNIGVTNLCNSIMFSSEVDYKFSFYYGLMFKLDEEENYENLKNKFYKITPTDKLLYPITLHRIMFDPIIDDQIISDIKEHCENYCIFNGNCTECNLKNYVNLWH